MTKLERELKSVNEKLQLAENYKTLKQQREENEQVSQLLAVFALMFD